MIHDDSASPVFAAGNESVFEDYSSVDESVHWANFLLLHQFNTDDAVKGFLLILYKLLDRVENNKNALLIAGEPKSGKTWFVKKVSSYMVTHGVQKNLSKNMNFPFQDCVRRRLIIWDEPRCERSQCEDLKLLFGGTDMSVSTKHQADALRQRTPVILMSNDGAFIPDEEAFRSHVWIFVSRKYNMWEKAPKHLHPKALYKL